MENQEIECWNGCGFTEPYGWVPEADCPVHDPSTKHRAIIAEFGLGKEGLGILAEHQQIEDHVRRNKITEHSINADGSCNMGCC